MPNVKPYNYQQIHDRRLAESICVAAVVSVAAFDPAKMTVDVQPLSNTCRTANMRASRLF